MIISIDIDGVLAGGEYIPEWERYPERYLSLPLLEENLPHTIHKLARKHSLYLLSSRAFPNALDITRLWLEKVGFSLTDFCGVLVGFGKDEKVTMVNLLKADLHIDDDYRVVEIGGIPANKCLFVYHEAARSHYPWSNWAVNCGMLYYQNWKAIIGCIDLISSPDSKKLLSTAGDANRESPERVPPVAAGRVELGRSSPPRDQLEALRWVDYEP